MYTSTTQGEATKIIFDGLISIGETPYAPPNIRLAFRRFLAYNLHEMRLYERTTVKGKLDFIFRPQSIAVIGATNRKGSIGRELLHNVIDYEFEGKVFPVNPTKSVIHSIKCYSTILDVPDKVDLAVIVVPKEHTLEVLSQCGEKGVKGILMITAGFKETGPAGAELELKVLETVRKFDMRMVGPNCFGIVNADPRVHLDATFSKIRPSFGKIGLISQSGAMGEAILAQAQDTQARHVDVRLDRQQSRHQ